MIQFSKTNYAGFRVDVSPGHRGEAPPYTVGEGLRYTAGHSIPGMEFQPDYFNGKTDPIRPNLCVICGRAILSQKSKRCHLHVSDLRAQAARSRGKHERLRETHT